MRILHLAGRAARQVLQDHLPERCHRAPCRPGSAAVPGGPPEPVAGGGVYLCCHPGRRGPGHRCLYTAYRRLTGSKLDADRAGAGRAGAGLWSWTGTEGQVHHSDHCVQYLSIRCTTHLAAAGVGSSVGSIGDSYDNAPT